MYKLCSLKDMVPGSVVELPKEYQSCAGEKAIVLGLEYASDNVRIRTELIKQAPDKSFLTSALPTLPDDTQLAVVEDKALQAAALKAFITHKFELPEMGMSTGCDPEIFVLRGDDSIFPAWEYMLDEEAARAEAKQWLTKAWPHPHKNNDGSISEINYAGSTWNTPSEVWCPERVPAYWDGAQAEFAPWAKTCLETLHYGTRKGLQAVLEAARRKDPLAKLTLHNVIELPEALLKNTENKYIQFRCSQSYNVYNDPGDGIQDARKYKYRCAGGHIHLGYSRAFTAPGIEQIVRGLDGVLGIIGVSLAAGIDNPERRRTYGRAGEFRLPKHGLEYRVLSNFWLAHPAIAMLVFEIARASVRLAESGLFNLYWQAREEETREVINNCDVNGAREILRKNLPVLIGMLHGIWAPAGKRTETDGAKMRDLALKAIFNGIGAVIDDPFAIEKNWKLEDQNWMWHCRGEGDSWLSLSTGKK